MRGTYTFDGIVFQELTCGNTRLSASSPQTLEHEERELSLQIFILYVSKIRIGSY